LATSLIVEAMVHESTTVLAARSDDFWIERPPVRGPQTKARKRIFLAFWSGTIRTANAHVGFFDPSRRDFLRFADCLGEVAANRFLRRTMLVLPASWGPEPALGKPRLDDG
jgi:hypothetical protein